MNTRTLLSMLVAGVYLGIPISKHALAGAATGDQRIPMCLEIALDSPRCVPFQNFTLTVRIVNPNAYSVALNGFEFGYIEPEIEVADADGEFMKLHCAGVVGNALGGPPRFIAAHGALERRRFLFTSFGGGWPMEPGMYRIRANSHLSARDPENLARYIGVEWTSNEVTLTVKAAKLADQRAMESLVERVIEYEQGVRRNGVDRSGVFHAGLFGEFLERYPDSVYVPQIRWALVKLLPIELDYKYGPLYDDPEMVQLLEECLTFCLDRGGAYSEEFLSWKSDGRGNHLMKLARQYRRFELLKRIAKELDTKHPDDKPAIMFRQVTVAAVTESKAAGQRAADKLREQFPDSPYAERASQFVKYLERQEARQRSEAP